MHNPVGLDPSPPRFPGGKVPDPFSIGVAGDMGLTAVSHEKSFGECLLALPAKERYPSIMGSGTSKMPCPLIDAPVNRRRLVLKPAISPADGVFQVIGEVKYLSGGQPFSAFQNGGPIQGFEQGDQGRTGATQGRFNRGLGSDVNRHTMESEIGDGSEKESKGRLKG